MADLGMILQHESETYCAPLKKFNRGILVQCESSTAEDLASIAMAENVLLLVLLELDGPLSLAAVALAVVCSHFGWSIDV